MLSTKKEPLSSVPQEPNTIKLENAKNNYTVPGQVDTDDYQEQLTQTQVCHLDKLKVGVSTLCFVEWEDPSVSVITVTYFGMKTIFKLRLVRSPTGPCWI
jgi:hypothetical protein